MEANDKRKPGRPVGTTKGVTPSKTIRVPQDIADLIKDRFNDTTNQRLIDWIKKLP